MNDHLMDALDAARFNRQREQQEQPTECLEQRGEDESYVTPEMIEATRIKGDNER